MALPSGPGSKPFGGAPLDPRAREEQRRTDQRRQEQVADRCGELEETLEQLRTRYELFFVGVERREPSRERDETKRAIARLKGESASVNTGLRFRIDTLHARFVSYERMWMRSAREKEEGTYRRDLVRLRRKAGRVPAAETKRRAGPVSESPVGPSVPSEKQPLPAAPEPPTPSAGNPPPSAPVAGGPPPRAAGLSADQLQALYAAYVDAKKRCNEDVSRITYEALARTIERQVPELLAKTKAKSVEFRVLIKDGKAVLKAVPRM